MHDPRLLTRPRIVICVCPHFRLENKLREVQAGLEEEGIPSETVTGSADNAAVLARLGAEASQLEVGVGLAADGVSVHHRKLPSARPLFSVTDGEDPGAWRNLGHNAARLVKGTPLKDPPVPAAIGDHSGNEAELAIIIGDIVRRITNQTTRGDGR